MGPRWRGSGWRWLMTHGVGFYAALVNGPGYPSELADALGLTLANVSNHLSCLRGCGLVVAVPEGRRCATNWLTDSRERSGTCSAWCWPSIPPPVRPPSPRGAADGNEPAGLAVWR